MWLGRSGRWVASHSQLVAQAAPEGAVRAVRGPPGGTRGMAAVRRDCVRSQGGRAVVGKNPGILHSPLPSLPPTPG